MFDETGLRKYSEQAMPEMIFEAHSLVLIQSRQVLVLTRPRQESMIKHECYSSSIVANFKHMKTVVMANAHMFSVYSQGALCRWP